MTHLSSPFGRRALCQGKEILFWAMKINKTIATSLLLALQPEFVIWWRRSISTHVLGPSISVKWVKHCTLPFTFLVTCAGMVASLWHLQSSWSWECKSSGRIWSLTTLPTQRTSLTASKSFSHITNSQKRLDWIWSSLLWAAWRSEKTHFSFKSLHLFSSNFF